MRHKTTDDEFLQAISESISIREVFLKLGIAPAGGNYKTFYVRVKKIGANISHFQGKSHMIGKKGNRLPIPLAKLLTKNSSYNSGFLKRRLIKEGLLNNKCSIPECGISSWLGGNLVLHLDHIDGNNTNNEIVNLRLLCPNCHSQTPTYCGRNIGKVVI